MPLFEPAATGVEVAFEVEVPLTAVVEELEFVEFDPEEPPLVEVVLFLLAKNRSFSYMLFSNESPIGSRI